MRRLLAVLWKDVALRLTDPAVLLLAIAMPLAITALVELAFGNLVLGRGLPGARIPVAVVNQDEGGRWGNFGDALSYAMTSGPEASALPDDLGAELFDMREMEGEAEARRMVERRELVAALFIPPDFSRALEGERATLRAIINDRYRFRGEAFESVIETVASTVSIWEATVRAAAKGLMDDADVKAQLRSGELNEMLAELALAAGRPASNPIKIRVLPGVGQSTEIELTHYLAAAIAIFFSGYTALLGSASLLRERAEGTLQRMLTAPTPPGIILGGKTLGTYVKGLIQMVALVGGLAGLEWALKSGPTQVPRIDPIGLSLLILALVAAVTGVGVAVAGLCRTYTQAANYGAAALLVMALAGGIFFPVDLFPKPMQALSRVTFHYWAMGGYLKLARGGSVVDVVPHVAILGAMGLALAAIGGSLLRRRLAVV